MVTIRKLTVRGFSDGDHVAITHVISCTFIAQLVYGCMALSFCWCLQSFKKVIPFGGDSSLDIRLILCDILWNFCLFWFSFGHLCFWLLVAPDSIFEPSVAVAHLSVEPLLDVPTISEALSPSVDEDKKINKKRFLYFTNNL